MTALVILDLMLIAGAVVAAFVWMRPVVASGPRIQRAWTLVGIYALAALLLWWAGLLRADYPPPAALLVGGGVGALHIAFVGLVVWLAAQRPASRDS